MEEPATFTTAKVVIPRSLANRRAASVSAVSPDWEISTTREVGVRMGSR